MSEHNPFDDEEQFTETNNGIPPDADVIRTITDQDILLLDVTKQIKDHFDKGQLTEVTLTFEYSDAEGFCSWITTHYRRK